MEKFEAFIGKEKFTEDPDLLYPGLSDPALRPELTKLVNLAAQDFREVARGTEPTEAKFQAAIATGLERFSPLYHELDTEDRERICGYVEELMDLVGLESSNGQLNTFMYGFDPAGE